MGQGAKGLFCRIEKREDEGGNFFEGGVLRGDNLLKILEPSICSGSDESNLAVGW